MSPQIINGIITVEPFIINSTSVNEYLLYIIGLDISTKYLDFDRINIVDNDDRFIQLHDLTVAIHHGVYVSVQYNATFECSDIAGCQHKPVRLPRIIVGDDRID